ncbi:MAG: PTS sugar transporter subunit IIA [Lentisphaeria bacterium]|nr:PTS sugar transporter subunit IIA [Lentisphaeria bacterium]
MILTLKELAEYLRVNERTILRMLKTGKIQGAKIGGQWRFNGSQIDRVFFPSTPIDEDDEDMPMSVLTRPHIGIPVSRLMNEERIILDMKATNIEEAIAELTDPRFFFGLVLDVLDLREKCMARENVLSTGIGNGIAIPHPRDPITTLRAPGSVIYGYSKQGIDFKAPDGNPVHTFFLICSQNIELHLHLMGCMARLLKNDDFVNALPSCENNGDIIKLVMEQERDEFMRLSGNDDNSQ